MHDTSHKCRISKRASRAADQLYSSRARLGLCNLNLKLSLYLFWQRSFLLIQKRKVGNYYYNCINVRFCTAAAGYGQTGSPEVKHPLLKGQSARLPRADRLLFGGWCKATLAPPDQRYEFTQCAVGQEANAEHQLQTYI